MLKRIFWSMLLPILVLVNISWAQTNSAANEDVEKCLELCKSSLQKGETDKAISYGEKAVELDKNSSAAYLILGMAYGQKAQEASIFKKLSYAKKCKAAWEKTLQIDGQNTEAMQYLISYHMSAPGIAGGDKETAKSLAVELGKIDAGLGHLALARIFESQKKFPKAEEEYRKAAESDPQKTDYYFALSLFYMNQKEYGKAGDALLRIREKDPQDTRVIYQLGKIALLSGKDLEKGLAYFEAYLNVQPKLNAPTWADACWRRGLIYEKLGDMAQAEAEYQKALKLNHEHKGAQEALAKIKKSAKNP
ncbi:MAG TPA: tetratricopeptide repeat protein [Acidobacteriota bacterium]